MSKVIIFSTHYPSYHPKKGMPTFFVEKLNKAFAKLDLPEDYLILYWQFYLDLNLKDEFSPKYHTIRSGNRFKEGDLFSPRVWGNDINPKSGKSGPYHSKQIVIAPNIEVKKVWDFKIDSGGSMFINEKHYAYYYDICKNDGLEPQDFRNWFKMNNYDLPMKSFDGQIICWSDHINY